MKRLSDLKTGRKIMLTGGIIALTCFLIPMLLIDRLDVDARICVIILTAQLFTGISVLLFGYSLSKKEKTDQNYAIPKNILKVFSVYQHLMIGAMLSVMLMEVSIYIGFDWIGLFFAFMFEAMIVAAVIVAIVRYRKKKTVFVPVGNGRMVHPKVVKKRFFRCCKCKGKFDSDNIFKVGGKRYCRDCRTAHIFEKKTAANVENNRGKCDICHREFPKSLFHMVNGKYICEECFKEKFTVDLS